MSTPTVSVVIPTTGRPYLRHAIDSVLAQTHPVEELLICLDAEVEIKDLLPEDPRIRVIKVGPAAGGNVARQSGIRAARGELIALLDDDDEWVRDKLAVQIADVSPRVGSDWIATSRLTARFSDHDEVWPKLLKPAEQPLSAYVLRKARLKGGQGFIQASTLLFPRDLGLRVPFDEGLRFHQDTDWLLALEQSLPEIEVVQSERPLTTYHVGRPSVSSGGGIDPLKSADWAVSRIRDDPRSLGDFMLTISLTYAARRGDLIAFARVAVRAVRDGRPGLPAYGFALYRLAQAVLAAGRRARSRLLSRSAKEHSA